MANEIKRHFYNGIHYELDEVNKVVRLLPELKNKLETKTLWGKFGYKKIGGSSIGDVLKVDQWKSEFGAFCRMSWIGLPILDRKYVDAGIEIEPKVIEAIEKSSGKKVKTYDPYEYNFDFFSDKDDVVGGLPDGFIEETQTIIEIKTTGEKNLEKWAQWGIPPAYLKQAQLYSYLMGVDKYAIVSTFLKEEDYINPKTYPIKQRKVKSYPFLVNKEQAMDDIKIVKEWHEKYTNSGISPQYNESLDKDLLKWLKVSNAEQWNELKQKWIDEGKLVL